MGTRELGGETIPEFRANAKSQREGILVQRRMYEEILGGAAIGQKPPEPPHKYSPEGPAPEGSKANREGRVGKQDLWPELAEAKHSGQS